MKDDKGINKSNIGSALDDFLASENMLSEATAVAHKRVLAWQIKQAMQKKHVTKVEMAKRMHTSRAVLDRLLNPNNPGVTLGTIDRAAAALGMKLDISMSERNSNHLDPEGANA